MKPRIGHLLFFAFSIAPIAVFSAQQEAVPTSDQVFKDIKVFKGVPANDLIPAMEFMSASLGWECSDCHDPKDYAASTEAKETARAMVLMQREINKNHFNNRLEVTCMSCHNGKEHPAGAAIPTGVATRHERLEPAPKPEDVLAKHVAAVGKAPASITRTGTLTAPNDVTHKTESHPATMVQAEGGKFMAASGDRKFGSDGKQVWYGPAPMVDEPAAIFSRIGRAYRGADSFAGLERLVVSGKDKIGKTDVIVIRASRPATTSTEEMYFDSKSGLLLRLVNMKRSTIGTVVTSIDYSNYKSVRGAKVPMKVETTFAGNQKWTMEFKSAKAEDRVDETLFKMGG